MSPKNNFYSIANNVRTKLLLFIDKEIQLQNKNHNHFIFNKKNYKEETHCINIEETYSQKKTEIVFSNSKLQSKITISKDTIKTTSTCNDTPKITNETHCNDEFYLKDKIYSINKEIKPSSTFLIYEKPKTDKSYLKNLCDSLKLSKKYNGSSFMPTHIKNIKNNNNKLNTLINKGNSNNSFKKNKLGYLNEKRKQTDYLMNIKYQKSS